jgi:GNAT superfamily N-acetyltransferase
LITLAAAVRDDVPAIAELAAEMDRYHGAAQLDPPEVRQGQIDAALFGEPKTAQALLAWDDGKLVGFATYTFLWPAVGLASSLYLKELYVAAVARRTGVGEVLMRGLFEIAVSRECVHVEWTADTDNMGARAFYEDLGLLPTASKLFYRIAGADLAKAAQPPPHTDGHHS